MLHVSECPFVSASTSHRLLARLTQSLMCNLVPERCAMMGHSVCQRQIIRWRLLFFASRQWWPFRLRPHIALTAGKYYSIAEVPSCARDRTMFGRSLCQGLVCAYFLPHVSECSFFSARTSHRLLAPTFRSLMCNLVPENVRCSVTLCVIAKNYFGEDIEFTSCLAFLVEQTSAEPPEHPSSYSTLSAL